jgi:hypothetical protein
MWINGVEGLRCVGVCYGDGSDGVGRICDGGNRLIDSVLVNGLDHIRGSGVRAEAIGHRKALVKPAIPRTQNGLRRLLTITMAQRVSE